MLNPFGVAFRRRPVLFGMFPLKKERRFSLLISRSDHGDDWLNYMIGVLVAYRSAGGGFGGSTVNLEKGEACDDFIEHLKDQFTMEFRPERELNDFTTQAAACARIIATC